MWSIKTKLVVFGTVLVGAIGILIGGATIWIRNDRMRDEKITQESVVVKDSLEIAAGDKRRVMDFLEKLDGEIVENYEIVAEYPGEIEAYFEYFDINGQKRLEHFTIQIVDKTTPKIYGGSYFTVPVGYGGDLTNLMLSGDDFDDNPERKIVGEYDLGKTGKYNLEYVITDNAGNLASQKFVLEIVQPSDNKTDTPQVSEAVDFDETVAEYKTAKTKIGIDVSSWQGEIDWQKVQKAGVEFVMIRVGYQAGYDGEYVLDKYFENNISGAAKVGLPVGVYFYSYATSVEQAISQAEWVAEKLQDFQLDLGVAFDWEDWGSFNEVGMSFYTINKVAGSFLETVENAGYNGILYGSKNYLERIWQPKVEYDVWLAQYYNQPTYKDDFWIWQMSDSGRVDGIYGNVDLDVMYIN